MKQTEGSAVRKRTSTKKQPPVVVAPVEEHPSQAVEPGEATPSREARVREVAYALYVSRGGRDGNDVDDWLAAEAVVSGEPLMADPNVAPSEE